MAINNVVLTGRLSRDPEIKQTQSGVSVCNFCIAVDRKYKSGEEKICDFINCVAWRGAADFVSKWFHKGDGIGVTGSINKIVRGSEALAGNKRKLFANLFDIFGIGIQAGADCCCAYIHGV